MTKPLLITLSLMFAGFGAKSQNLFELQFHYESINAGPYVYLDRGDSLTMDVSHKIGSTDIFFIRYTMRNELEAEKLLFKKEIAGAEKLSFSPMTEGCYQLRLVPGSKMRYFHGNFDVGLVSSNNLSGRTCTVDLDSGYMEIGNEKYLSESDLGNVEKFQVISEKKKKIHSNGVPYIEIRFDLTANEKAYISLDVDDESPRTNLWVFREGNYYKTDIFRTFQKEQNIGFKALRSGSYVVQYWGRSIFDRMEEVTVRKGR